ncbi:hypothetical protein OG21DRAFT_346764 [Imleria badia]|nr:hypothetical protein OG21DRAFT_346764 [Imleria badia]
MGHQNSAVRHRLHRKKHCAGRHGGTSQSHISHTGKRRSPRSSFVPLSLHVWIRTRTTNKKLIAWRTDTALGSLVCFTAYMGRFVIPRILVFLAVRLGRRGWMHILSGEITNKYGR